MTNYTALRFENLSKTFGRGKKSVNAVKNLNLEIESGQVYGFLGPNGAGKSTTIRMLMDLVRPTTGSAFAFGCDVSTDPNALKRVGALVEGAAFYGFLNARENLAVLARTANAYDSNRISSLLEQVRLADKPDRQFKDYSTGMKQRLGLAAALLGDPELVVLDEPTNGLDPSGIQEMRVLIREMAQNEGKTVFLSSHQLNEVEQICDRVAIINLGEIVREGKVAELLADGKALLRIQTSDSKIATMALQEEWEIGIEDKNWIKVNAPLSDSPKIIRLLVTQDIDVQQVVQQQQSLEEFFLDVTGEDQKNSDD